MDGETKLTEAVIGAAIEVHREIGPGLLESVYHRCMIREMTLRNIPFLSKAKLPIHYNGELIGEDMEMDFYFPGELVLEIKSHEKIIPIFEAQLLTYLRLSGTLLGLLINFNVRLLKDGLERMVLG